LKFGIYYHTEVHANLRGGSCNTDFAILNYMQLHSEIPNKESGNVGPPPQAKKKDLRGTKSLSQLHKTLQPKKRKRATDERDDNELQN
jgi:hypothetical protein